MDSQFDIKSRLYASRYIDCHSHQGQNSGVLALQNIELSNYTLQQNLPDFYSVGVHPWHISDDSQLQLLRIKNTGQLLAIGECGLDKAIDLSFSRQLAVFESQIALAVAWNKPLIIHCVRAYNELMTIKSAQKTGRAWLIHGCNTSFQQVEQLLSAGFYCSFGASLMNSNSKPAHYLSDLPADRWLLETDANRHYGIDDIYNSAAKILGWDVDALHQQMIKNFERIFLNDRSGLVISN